jgi:hypothetical protein
LFPVGFHSRSDIFDLSRGATPVATFADQFQSPSLNGSAIKLNSHSHLPALQKIGRDIFARWVALL